MDLMIKSKAEKIIKENERDISHFETCIEAGICPTCGEELTLEIATYIEGRIFKKKVEKAFVVCPERHKLIHPSFGEINNPCHYIYRSTINREIKEYKESILRKAFWV